jgi:hypothetical protein
MGLGPWYGRWPINLGKARTKGTAPISIQAPPARHSLAAHQTAKPRRRTFEQSCQRPKSKAAGPSRRARVHFAINPDAAKLKCVNTDFLHRLFHRCGGRSAFLMKGTKMQNQLSTATPDSASLLASGYLMETPVPDPPPPIDPPDNQGGGGNMTGTDPDAEEQESSSQ